MKIAIIGAGPSGLAAAYELTMQGIEVDIFEISDSVGGLAKSIDIFNKEVELGPHFLLLHADIEVKKIVEKLLDKDEVIKFDRLTRIQLDGKLYKYPPSIFNVLKNLGFSKVCKAIWSLILIKLFPIINNGSVETYVKNNLGIYLYNQIFKGYTEKLWGIPCMTIHEDYTKVLIGFGKLNMVDICKRILFNRNITLSSQCIYPIDGMSMLWNKLKIKIEQQGGIFYLNSNLKALLLNDNLVKGLVTSDGNNRMYDCIISTISESSLLALLPSVPKLLLEDQKNINHRSVLFLYLNLEK